jgi:hypothetical protein
MAGVSYHLITMLIKCRSKIEIMGRYKA